MAQELHYSIFFIQKIKKVNLCGTENEAATGNNAAFIVDNKIGNSTNLSLKSKFIDTVNEIENNLYIIKISYY